MTARILPIVLVASMMAPLALADSADADGSGGGSSPLNDKHCLLDPKSDELALVTESAGNRSLVLKVAAPATAERSISDLEIDCDGGALASVTARLAPRQEMAITLLVHNTRPNRLKFNVASLPVEVGKSFWLAVDPAAGTVPAGQYRPVKLVVSVPADFSPGTRHDQLLTFTVDDGQDRFTRKVPMQLEVEEEEALFRDEFKFEVDPELGQFSFRIGNSGESAGTY